MKFLKTIWRNSPFVLTLFAFVFIVFSTTAQTATSLHVATVKTTECAIGDYKAAIIAEINTIRSKAQVCGGVVYPAVGALKWNDKLEAAAAVHATDMAVNNHFDHRGTDGSRVGERTRGVGYIYSRVGENIAGGQSLPSLASSDWLTSPSHCANIMTASFVDLGVSCKYKPDSAYQYYWTLVMGSLFWK